MLLQTSFCDPQHTACSQLARGRFLCVAVNWISDLHTQDFLCSVRSEHQPNYTCSSTHKQGCVCRAWGIWNSRVAGSCILYESHFQKARPQKVQNHVVLSKIWILSKNKLVTRLLWEFRIWGFRKENKNNCLSGKDDFLKPWAEANKHFFISFRQDCIPHWIHKAIFKICGFVNETQVGTQWHLWTCTRRHSQQAARGQQKEEKCWEVHLNNTHSSEIISCHPGSAATRTRLLHYDFQSWLGSPQFRAGSLQAPPGSAQDGLWSESCNCRKSAVQLLQEKNPAEQMMEVNI